MIIPGLNILDMKPICIGNFAIVHFSIVTNIVTNNTIVIILRDLMNNNTICRTIKPVPLMILLLMMI